MLRALVLILAVILGIAGWGYADGVADPLVRRANVQFRSWPAGAPPIRVALISDIHVQGPEMPPERVARLAAEVNALRPDLILLAGDFVGDRQFATRDYPDGEIARALAGLRAPLGTWAVLGNHDHWRDGAGMRRALEAAGIPVLENGAARVGPVTLVGIGDAHTGHADAPAAERAAAALPGPLVAFLHSPDAIPGLAPRFALVLAGHTHCGQIVLPLVGALAHASRYGMRYRCGIVREGERTTVVTAGWGTSVLPMRFGAPPDWWLLTLGPVPGPPRS
ncbi:MAG: metallophosphoesterase [Sphingomonas sp.]